MLILKVFEGLVRNAFLRVLTKFHDSIPFQVPKHTVLHQESDFQVENVKFCQLERKNNEKRDEYYQVLILKVFCDHLQNTLLTV